MERRLKFVLVYVAVTIVTAVVVFFFLMGCLYVGTLIDASDVYASEKVFHWTKEGTSPFWKTPLRSEQDLKALFQNNAFKSKLAKRLQTKEPSWDGAEVVKLAENAVRNGEFERVVIQPRTEEAEFEWMLAGENWKSDDDAIVVWSGDHPLNAFLVPIVYEGEQVNLFFGNHCVNVLKKRRKAEKAPGEYGKGLPPKAEYVPPKERAEVYHYHYWMSPPRCPPPPRYYCPPPCPPPPPRCCPPPPCPPPWHHQPY